MPSSRYLVAILIISIGVMSTACSFTEQAAPFVNAEPDVGSVQTRAPRTLRLYFEKLPDVSRSNVSLAGPNGELNLRGLHTMGANDLMMEINDQVASGEYTVRWQTYLANDPNLYTGSYSFTVQSE